MSAKRKVSETQVTTIRPDDWSVPSAIVYVNTLKFSLGDTVRVTVELLKRKRAD